VGTGRSGEMMPPTRKPPPQLWFRGKGVTGSALVIAGRLKISW